MPAAYFSPHGLLKISVDDNLVTVDVVGPCNTEFFQEMASKLAEISPNIDNNNYTALIVLRGEALATQDAMEYFTNYMKTVNVRAVALNLQYASTPALTEQICDKAYTDAGVNHQFFYDNDSAIKWLRACMQAE